jgi:hypothetical protein
VPAVRKQVRIRLAITGQTAPPPMALSW